VITTFTGEREVYTTPKNKFYKMNIYQFLVIISTVVLVLIGCNLSLDPIPDYTTIQIQFKVESSQIVVLGIYDRGREIRRMVDEQLSPGMYSVVWEGTDSGGKRIYINKNYTARLRGENNSSVVMFKIDKNGDINVDGEIVSMLILDPIE